MAGRKDKNTVDYFPHYCKSGKTLFILENKFGNDGYAVWFKILELLGSNDNHYINCNDLSNWEFLQAQMRVTENKLNDILNCLSNLNAIHAELWENKIVWSGNFIKNINDAYIRRKTECMQFYDLCTHLSIKCKHKYDENGIIILTNTQSKVKESKEDESKVKEIKIEFVKSEIEIAFDEFEKMRIKIKKPMTDLAKEMIKKELIKLSGNDMDLAVKILNQSIVNSWQDVYPLKNKNSYQKADQKQEMGEAFKESLIFQLNKIKSE